MSFAWPLVFWLLLPVAALFLWEITHLRAAASDPHPKILRAEAGRSALILGYASFQRNLRPRSRWRLWLGLALAVLALARPQWGRLEEPVFEQARDIIIAMDLSRSMLSPDVKPSRLERSRLLVSSLLEKLSGERVGLVVFSGTAFLQSPLSADYEILREFLPSLGPDYLPEGGTNYQAMIEASLNAFGSASGADRFLIVLSDGEAEDDGWKASVPDLKERGIRVLGLGVGTADGAMIPDGSGGFMKDERGAVVLSKLESATLRQLAGDTNGVYVDASSWVDLAQLVQTTVDKGRRGDFHDLSRVRLAERFQWALAPAILLLLWSFYAEFPVRPRPRKLKFSPAAVAVLGLLLAVLAHPTTVFAAINTTAPSADATPPEAPGAPLGQLVKRLAGAPALSAADCATLARTTLAYGEDLQSAQQPVPTGPVQDGLAAVDAGSALDAKAADWNHLRDRLEKLLEKKDQQKQPDQDKPKPDQSKPDQSKDQSPKDQSKPDQQKQDSQSKDQKNSPSDKSGDPSGQPQNSSTSPDQPKDNPGKSDQQNPSQPDQKQNPTQPPAKKDQSTGKGDKAFDQLQPPPSATPQESSGETQQVGGVQPQTAGARPPVDPTLVIPLQKLEQVRDQDSPAHLFQLMQDTPPAARTNRAHNW